MTNRKFGAALVTALALLAARASAQTVRNFPSFLEPGSVLIYPIVDSRMGIGRGTVISVANVNGSTLIDPRTGYRRGTVQVRFYYATVPNGGSGWLLTDIPELLTPNDILTVLAGDHNPQAELGWLFVLAEDPETEELIDFNYLVGDEVVVDASDNRSVHFPAMAFQAMYSQLNGPPSPLPPPPNSNYSNLGYWFTDRVANGGNANGSADFNGIEYVNMPDRVFVSSFLELSDLQAMGADLILLSTLGRDFRLTLRFLIYDNEEDQFSRTFNFTCWTRVALQDISNVVVNLNGSARPGTPVEEQQTGWMRINGDVAYNPLTRQTVLDPPFVGAIIQRVVAQPNDFEFGHLLHKTGRNAIGHNLPSTTIVNP